MTNIFKNDNNYIEKFEEDIVDSKNIESQASFVTNLKKILLLVINLFIHPIFSFDEFE